MLCHWHPLRKQQLRHLLKLASEQLEKTRGRWLENEQLAQAKAEERLAKFRAQKSKEAAQEELYDRMMNPHIGYLLIPRGYTRCVWISSNLLSSHKGSCMLS